VGKPGPDSGPLGLRRRVPPRPHSPLATPHPVPAGPGCLLTALTEDATEVLASKPNGYSIDTHFML